MRIVGELQSEEGWVLHLFLIHRDDGGRDGGVCVWSSAFTIARVTSARMHNFFSTISSHVGMQVVLVQYNPWERLTMVCIILLES
jgi:hypothetical protein